MHVPLAPLVDLSRLPELLWQAQVPVGSSSVTEIPVNFDSVSEPPTSATPSEPPTAPAPPVAGNPDADTGAALVPGPRRPLGKHRRKVATTVQATARSPEATLASETIADAAAVLDDAKLSSPRASLRLLLHVNRLRGHGMAASVAAALRGVEQWRGLFEDNALEPMRDIERLLLLAPSVNDSRRLLSIFEYNVPRFRVRQLAVSDAGHECAFPSPSTLVIGPPGERAHLDRIPRTFRLPGPTAGELLLLHVDQPARAFARLPWKLPSSLRWSRVQLTLTPEGGARVELLARDSSAWAAANSARSLRTTLGTNVIADGDRLRAGLQLPPEVLPTLLDSTLAALGASLVSAGARGGLDEAAERADCQRQACKNENGAASSLGFHQDVVEQDLEGFGSQRFRDR